MKFISLTEHFRSSASLAERAIGKSMNLPILSHFLLQAEKNRILLSATNLEIALTTSFAGKIDETGAITIPARVILDFLSQIGEEKIEVSVAAHSLKLNAGGYKAAFQGLDPEEFPIIPKIQTDNQITLTNDKLRQALGQVINAANFGQARPELAGVNLNYEPGGNLKLVATDSFRLAEKTIGPQDFSASSQKFSAFIPIRTAQEVLRIVQERGGEVKIGIDPNQVLFSWEDIDFISRLLENDFPEYHSIIPKNYLAEALVPRKKFIEALKVSGVFSSKINEVHISLQPPDRIVIKSANAAIGENEAVVPCQIKGETADLAFNYKFLIDGLENVWQDTVFFGVNQENSPAVIKGKDDPAYFYLLMPIRI